MKPILSAVLAVSLLAGAGAASAHPQQYDQRGGDQRGDARDNGGDHRGDNRDNGGYNRGDNRDNGGDHRDNRGDRYDHGGQRFDHQSWHKGGRVDRDEWRHGQRIDYRSRHLRRPPRGYEWRQVNGDYVLGAVATGLIADLLLNNH